MKLISIWIFIMKNHIFVFSIYYQNSIYIQVIEYGFYLTYYIDDVIKCTQNRASNWGKCVGNPIKNYIEVK